MQPLTNAFDRQKDPNLFRTVRKINRLLKEQPRPPNGKWELTLTHLWTTEGVNTLIQTLKDSGFTVERSNKDVRIAGTQSTRVHIVFTHPHMETIKRRNHTIVAGGIIGAVAIVFLIFYLTSL
jgi:hypothetical protein